MFALTGGELAMVLFLFALVWGAVLLPRLGERVAVWLLRRSREARETTHTGARRDGG